MENQAVKDSHQGEASLRRWLEPVLVLAILGSLFGYLGSQMGLSALVNTLFNTAHQLLLNTVLFIMGITVLSGALSQLLSEFGVIRLLEVLLAPLMKPVFRLPGRTALAALMTFFSDNPAVISLARDSRFRKGFTPWQLVSLTNFGTAFGMGLIVVTFMATLQLPGGESTASAALIGLLGALIGSVVSTRLMQRMIRPLVGETPIADEVASVGAKPGLSREAAPTWLRVLNALLDGGKSGVELGMAVIPGVLIISTFVMLLTFGPGEKGYTGEASRGWRCCRCWRPRWAGCSSCCSASPTPSWWPSRSPRWGRSGPPCRWCPLSSARAGSPATRWRCSPPWACAGAVS